MHHNGDFTLQVPPGRTVATPELPSRPLGIPFGTYPRLQLAYLTSEAVRMRSPEVYVVRSLADAFRRMIGVEPSGGRTGNLVRAATSSVNGRAREPVPQFSAGDDRTPGMLSRGEGTMHNMLTAAAMVVAVLGQAGGGGAASTPQAADPAVDMPHETTWTEVEAAPLPIGLPLSGPKGRGADGYPLQHVDRPALRSLLVHRRFAGLSAILETLQEAFEKDPSKELWISDAVDTLGLANPRDRELLDAWLAATPNSFAPHLINAGYWHRLGFVRRGRALRVDTSDAEWAQMRDAFRNAREAAETALRLRPRLMDALDVLISIEIAAGSREQAEVWLARALRICPFCYEIRANWISWALLPRWGGSIEEMQAFATSRLEPRNPRHRLLAGFIDLEHANQAGLEGRWDEVRPAVERACARGDDWRFLRARAAHKKAAGDLAGALSDLERAEAFHPGLPAILADRARTYADAQRWEDAGHCALQLFRSRPTFNAGGLRDRIVRALAVLSATARREGKIAHAERLDKLVNALAPRASPSPAAVAVAVKVPPPYAPAAVTTPRSIRPQDPTPAVVVQVVDAAGATIQGARVMVLPGSLGWEGLVRSMEEPHPPALTDASGRCTVRAAPGQVTVIAATAAYPWSGAAVAAVVGAAGAEVKVVLAPSERIEGTVVDRERGTPIAGVEVRAIPEVEALALEPRGLGVGVSDEAGKFSVAGVDTQRYRVFVRGKGYVGPWPTPTTGAEVRGGTRQLRLEVDREGLLRGRVLVTNPGQPPRPPAQFGVSGLNVSSGQFQTADGRFELPIKMASLKEWITFTVPGRPAVARQVELKREGVDLGDVFVGPGRKVRGTVLDPRGLAAQGASVRGTDGRVLAWTDINGRFEAVVQEGAATLAFEHRRWLGTTQQVAGDQEVVDVSLMEGARVKFLMVDEAGGPIANTTVTVTLKGIPRGCATDPNGRCQVSGLEGGAAIVSSGPVPPSGLAGPDLHLTLVPGSESALLVRRAGQHTRVRVHVLDFAGQEIEWWAQLFPGSPALVDALDDSCQARLPHYVSPAGRPLEGLAADRYTVFTRDAWGKHCAAAQLELGPGESKDITLRLGDGNCK